MLVRRGGGGVSQKIEIREEKRNSRSKDKRKEGRKEAGS
jgi:hypothetical protein